MIDKELKDLIDEAVSGAEKECKILLEKIYFDDESGLKSFLRTLARIKLLELVLLRGTLATSPDKEVIGEASASVFSALVKNQIKSGEITKEDLEGVFCPIFEQARVLANLEKGKKEKSGQEARSVVLYEKALKTLTNSISRLKSGTETGGRGTGTRFPIR